MSTPLKGHPRSLPVRRLRFASIDELLTELDAIEQAHRAGTLAHAGRWHAGKIMGHIAGWIDFGYDGYPMRVPWFVRTMATGMVKVQGRKAFDRALPSGYRIPGAPEGTFAVEDIPVEVGLERLRGSLRRLAQSPPSQPNPLFGALSHDQWRSLHLRHAELHLGYLTLRPRDDAPAEISA